MKFFKDGQKTVRETIDSAFEKLSAIIEQGKEEYCRKNGEYPSIIVMTEEEFKIVYDKFRNPYWSGSEAWKKRPMVSGMLILIDPGKQ